MKVLRPAHRYELEFFEEKDAPGQVVQFIEKEPELNLEGKATGELRTIYDGTTNEEVLTMLIDRMQHLQSKFPCRENAIVITKLEESLMWLNKRTQDRINRGVEGKHVK